MSRRYIGLAAVVAIAATIVAYKQVARVRSAAVAPAAQPAVVLVADLNEADSKCGCGEIIRAVRRVRQRGVAVSELMPDSNAELLKRYRVMTAPTVLILDRSGAVVSRYEGEEAQTIEHLRAALSSLAEAHR